ncbi:Fic family protein [Leucothrix pacifica]|uniref:Cell filamentation protein Fic n=1 Tax=Leucothrix pacifica TaxID=1247513 RepID=A0A317C3L9_9GAMM|nr:Fic family protein [Leucothrix pacifica]PWQ93245.1 cell filamentation protein Fic [Leucothrix pacifica]
MKAEDRDEHISLMEPLLVSDASRSRNELADLALELTAKSTALRTSLPEGIVRALSDLVRSMNCYYSNLIEGHDTHPIDIERALNEDYSTDTKKRDLQLEAKAHIEVQRWIDNDGLKARATSVDGVLETHRRFCELLPDELLWVESPDGGKRERLLAGEFRQRDVMVGKHIAISAGALHRFMKRFETAYQNLGKVDSITSAAYAHHRLLWMYPFLDGNGRVARLISYSILRDALDTGGIWSVARGLARNEAKYKSLLAQCDLPRQSERDGRGNLSEAALANFAIFFLETCIDQVDFMETLVNPKGLRDRILVWAEEEMRADRLPQKSGMVLEAVLYRGELHRGDVAGILGTGDRNARRITSALLERGVLVSKSVRAPLLLNFPAALAARWMPGLFPEG